MVLPRQPVRLEGCRQERRRGARTARTGVTRAGWAGQSSGAAIISRDKSKASAGASP